MSPLSTLKNKKPLDINDNINSIYEVYLNSKQLVFYLVLNILICRQTQHRIVLVSAQLTPPTRLPKLFTNVSIYS